MRATTNAPKPGTLLGIALTATAAAGALGAATNAVNGALSPTYFRAVLGWLRVENIWRAAVAQGIFEGLLYGAIFAIVFTLVVGIASKARVTYSFALKHLVLAGGIAMTGWCLGGLLAVGLAALSPDFYRSTFISVPSDFPEMLKYAWVGGSIWGVLFGATLAVIITSVVAAVNWRRESRSALG